MSLSMHIILQTSYLQGQDRFEYLEENWFGVYVQNNCEATDQNADQVLKKAWKYLEEYFIWEDQQEDEE